MVKRRTRTLLHIDNSLGFSGATFSPGAYGDAFIIEAQCELKKFAKAIQYLSDVINYPYLTAVKVGTSLMIIVQSWNFWAVSALQNTVKLPTVILFFNKHNTCYRSIPQLPTS